MQDQSTSQTSPYQLPVAVAPAARSTPVQNTAPSQSLAGLQRMTSAVEASLPDGSRPLPMTPLRASIPRQAEQPRTSPSLRPLSPQIAQTAASDSSAYQPAPPVNSRPVYAAPPPMAPPMPAVQYPVAPPATQQAPYQSQPAPVTPVVPAPQPIAVRPPVPSHVSKIYSHNTRAVWHSHRANKLWQHITTMVLLGVISVSVAYWLSIGAPTQAQDVPFIQSLLER